MHKAKSLLVKVYRHFMYDSLYRNSIFLMANTAALAGFGFIFWVIAAHYYTTSEVGIAATLMSTSTLIMTLSLFGFDNSFIHFLPKSKKFNEQIDTGLSISIIISLFASAIYLLVVRHMGISNLGFIDKTPAWIASFTAFMVINTLNNLTNCPFIAKRITHYILLINIGFGILRLLLLVLLARLGANGMLISHALATTIALALTFIMMQKTMRYSFKFRIVKSEVKKMGLFAVGNYFSNVFFILPSTLLPMIILSALGAKNSAYYYVASTIITALNIISLATSQSLLSEGSREDGSIRTHFIKSIKIVASLLLPTLIIVMALGKLILSLFGEQYSSGAYPLLLVLALACIPRAMNALLGTLARVKHLIRTLTWIYIIYSAVIICGSYWGFKHSVGLISVGWSTLVAETITTILFSSILVNHTIGFRTLVSRRVWSAT